MSMFHFVGGDDVTCPKCKHTYDVDWNTEYGDPLIGEWSEYCPGCRELIRFGVYIQYTQQSQGVT